MLGQNQRVLPGVTGPWIGTAAPRNTVSANASRSTACESAWRNSLRGSQAPRGSLAHLPGRRLKTNESASRLTPSSTIWTLPCCSSGPERLDVGRAQRLLHEVDLARLQPDDLRVLVGHELDGQAIEVRQLDAVLVLAPVPRVALEDQPLRRLVCASTNGPIDDELRRWRVGRPGLGERAGLQRGFELVLRHDRQVVEQADAGAEDCGIGHDHGPRVGRGDWSAACPSTIMVDASGLDGARVVQRLERKERHRPR